MNKGQDIAACSSPVPIRLLVDAHCFDQEYGGSRTFIRELYHQLAKLPGVQIFMAAYNVQLLKESFSSSPGLFFVKYKSRSRMVRLLYDIPRLVRKYRIDYTHFQYISSPWKNCRQILTIHDLLFLEYPGKFPLYYRLVKRFFFRRSAARADILTTVSDYSKSSLEKHFFLHPNRISIIANAVHERYFEPYNTAEAKAWIRKKLGFEKYLLCVSRFEPRKNQLLLLKLYLKLRLYEQGFHLLFLGQTSIPVRGFSSLVQSLEPAKRKFIHLVEAASDGELLIYYRAADLLVYPSSAEGFGLPPLEAAALRKPVICSNTSAMAAYTFFGEDHINPSKENNLYARLQHFKTKTKTGEELEKIAGQVQSNYQWKHSAEKLYELIKDNYYGIDQARNKIKSVHA